MFDQYRYGPRSVLAPGDRFRASGGPVYVTDDGKAISVADRGIYVFRRYCVQGTARWLEAYRADGSGPVILWVGKPSRSRVTPNPRRRPYRVAKVQNTKAARRRR
jgi:hypothetical protein